MSAKLVAQALSAELFSPYGEVIEVAGTKGSDMNDGRAQRYLQNVRFRGHPTRPPELYLSDVSPSRGPISLDYLERHPRSTQAFLPMRAQRYLVCVCLSDARGEPRTDTLRAFFATAPQGVNYAMGTWHYPIVAIDAPALFSVLMWSEDGAGDFAGNCDIFKLPDPPSVQWPDSAT
ncbi:MAG: ureidoglycolate lyase [Proteobacteria bacterium]|nr:ureidoglycolate lyase [Pseudomonadota bacterium]